MTNVPSSEQKAKIDMASWPVLVAEDHDEDWFFFQYACRKAGIRPPCHRVRNGKEAIHYLEGRGEYADRALHPLPRLIISDVRMPLADGFDFLSWLRTERKQWVVPFLFLSTSTSPTDIGRAYELGANAFLTKPGGITKFSEMLREVGAFWLGHNELPSGRPPPAMAAA